MPTDTKDGISCLQERQTQPCWLGFSQRDIHAIWEERCSSRASQESVCKPQPADLIPVNSISSWQQHRQSPACTLPGWGVWSSLHNSLVLWVGSNKPFQWCQGYKKGSVPHSSGWPVQKEHYHRFLVITPILCSVNSVLHIAEGKNHKAP